MNTIKDTTKKIGKALFNPENKLSLIPNWLSFSRAIGGIAIPAMVYSKASTIVILSTLSFVAISDYLDGKAARILVKKETKEGALLDAVSDKIFSLSLILAIIPIMPVYILNGLLESKIAYINNKILSSGGTPKSNLLGKIKIWPLSISLILSYLGLSTEINELLKIGTLLSLATIPLEIVNVKQYNDDYKKQITKKIEEKSEENKKMVETKEIKKEKRNNLKLSKTNHQAMVYELPNKENINELNSKIYKKNKH
ncbi:MAG: CDP-alcohol phosphatidyltransferase family protein [Bacilli bacterium]|nr:CDP-alcohol phosphatidyltransferase family protein [Bacilli bacterium]